MKLLHSVRINIPTSERADCPRPAPVSLGERADKLRNTLWFQPWGNFDLSVRENTFYRCKYCILHVSKVAWSGHIAACIMLRELCCPHLESSQHQSAFLGKFNLDESLLKLFGISVWHGGIHEGLKIITRQTDQWTVDQPLWVLPLYKLQKKKRSFLLYFL